MREQQHYLFVQLFWPSLDYISPISHLFANSAKRGLAQRSSNQSASNTVSGKWDDYLFFFLPSLIMITSFSPSLTASLIIFVPLSVFHSFPVSLSLFSLCLSLYVSHTPFPFKFSLSPSFINHCVTPL